MAGTMDKVKGWIKEVVGKVTGDRRTEAKGEAKDAARDVKESAKGVRDSLKGDVTR